MAEPEGTPLTAATAAPRQDTAQPAAASPASADAAGAAKAERIASIIRNGLTNSALSRDAVAWASLETRLPEIAAALLKEL